MGHSARRDTTLKDYAMVGCDAKEKRKGYLSTVHAHSIGHLSHPSHCPHSHAICHFSKIVYFLSPITTIRTVTTYKRARNLSPNQASIK